MDLFLADAQGLALALACGIFAGAAGRRGTLGTILLVAAAVGGAILFGASIATEDHPAWPGWPVGALFAGFAFVVTRDFAAAAAQRSGGAGFTGALIALAALALAAISLVAGPISLLVLAGLVWLWLGRRRRAASKHEGLRTLR